MAAGNKVIFESNNVKDICRKLTVRESEEKQDKKIKDTDQNYQTAKLAQKREIRKYDRMQRMQKSEEYTCNTRERLSDQHIRSASEPIQPEKPPRPKMTYRESTIEEPSFKDYENVPSRAPPNGHYPRPSSNGHISSCPPTNGHIETKSRGSTTSSCNIDQSPSRHRNSAESPVREHDSPVERTTSVDQRTYSRQRSNGFIDHSSNWHDNPICNRKYNASTRSDISSDMTHDVSRLATQSAPIRQRGDVSVFNKQSESLKQNMTRKTRPDSPVRKTRPDSPVRRTRADSPVRPHHRSGGLVTQGSTDSYTFSKSRTGQSSGRRRRLKESPPRYPPPPPRGKSSADVVQALSNKIRRDPALVCTPTEERKERHSRRRSWDIMMEESCNGNKGSRPICSTPRMEAEGQDTSDNPPSSLSIGSVDLSDISTLDRKEIIAILRRERESLLELKQYKERERRRRESVNNSSGSDTRYSELSGMSGLSLSSIDNGFGKENRECKIDSVRESRSKSGGYSRQRSEECCSQIKNDGELARRLQEEETLKARLRSVSVDRGIERSRSAGNLRPKLTRNGESLDCMYLSHEQFPYSERPVDCPPITPSTTPTPHLALLPPGCDAIRNISGSPVNTMSEPLNSPAPNPILQTPYRRRSGKKNKNKDKCTQQ